MGYTIYSLYHPLSRYYNSYNYNNLLIAILGTAQFGVVVLSYGEDIQQTLGPSNDGDTYGLVRNKRVHPNHLMVINCLEMSVVSFARCVWSMKDIVM